MQGLNIITADQRMAEKKSVKMLLLGSTGIGKTTQIRTLDPATTLFVDLEAGDLAVQDFPVDQIRPQTWPEMVDLACYLGGPNRNLPDTTSYSQKHFDTVVEKYGDESALAKYSTYFIDSITVASRICFKWCEQQPECTTRNGEKDVRATYGLLGREMMAWLSHLQHTRNKNVIFVCILDEREDEFNRKYFAPQIEGSKIAREMPGIVDEVVSMTLVRPEDGDPYRAFVCQPDNEQGLPAKDRSGRLACIEQPDLGKLIEKLTGANVPQQKAA